MGDFDYPQNLARFYVPGSIYRIKPIRTLNLTPCDVEYTAGRCRIV